MANLLRCLRQTDTHSRLKKRPRLALWHSCSRPSFSCHFFHVLMIFLTSFASWPSSSFSFILLLLHPSSSSSSFILLLLLPPPPPFPPSPPPSSSSFSILLFYSPLQPCVALQSLDDHRLPLRGLDNRPPVTRPIPIQFIVDLTQPLSMKQQSAETHPRYYTGWAHSLPFPARLPPRRVFSEASRVMSLVESLYVPKWRTAARQ